MNLLHLYEVIQLVRTGRSDGFNLPKGSMYYYTLLNRDKDKMVRWYTKYGKDINHVPSSQINPVNIKYECAPELSTDARWEVFKLET